MCLECVTGVLAYVGPGPGLTMFWAFLVLIGTVLLALVSVLFWPIRMMIRKMRGTPKSDGEPNATPPAPGQDAPAP